MGDEQGFLMFVTILVGSFLIDESELVICVVNIQLQDNSIFCWDCVRFFAHQTFGGCNVEFYQDSQATSDELARLP